MSNYFEDVLRERQNVNSKVLKIQEDQYSRIEVYYFYIERWYSNWKKKSTPMSSKLNWFNIISILLILLSFISTSIYPFLFNQQVGCWRVEWIGMIFPSMLRSKRIWITIYTPIFNPFIWIIAILHSI